MQALVARLALAAVGRIADVGLHPLYGCRPEQSGDGVGHGVLLRQPPAEVGEVKSLSRESAVGGISIFTHLSKARSILEVREQR